MQTPKFITKTQALELHQDQIESFGGTFGIRDEGLLDSALAQPQATFGGQLLHPTVYEQAAAYLFHLAKNHPFLDGNKRTAFAVADAFVRLNGYRINLSLDETYNLVLDVATGQTSKQQLTEIMQNSLIQTPQ